MASSALSPRRSSGTVPLVTAVLLLTVVQLASRPSWLPAGVQPGAGSPLPPRVLGGGTAASGFGAATFSRPAHSATAAVLASAAVRRGTVGGEPPRRHMAVRDGTRARLREPDLPDVPTVWAVRGERVVALQPKRP